MDQRQQPSSPTPAARLGAYFDSYADHLVLYARQWLGGGAAEDVVQDAFVRLLAQQVEPANVKAWLFRTVRNTALDARRANQRRQEREQQFASGRLAWFEADAANVTE